MNSKARTRIRKLIRALDGARGLERLESMPVDDEGFGFDLRYVDSNLDTPVTDSRVIFTIKRAL